MNRFAAIALVGLPGSGKSAIGRRLAECLRLDFADTDRVIEERLGCPIREFFEREGEARFRDFEEQVIDDLSANANAVLATGGGAVLREVNRIRLRSSFHVVYLCATPDDLFRRLRHDTKRPLLQVADPMQRLRDLHAERDPLYRATAHDIVETGRPSLAALTQRVLSQLEASGVVAPGTASSGSDAA